MFFVTGFSKILFCPERPRTFTPAFLPCIITRAHGQIKHFSNNICTNNYFLLMGWKFMRLFAKILSNIFPRLLMKIFLLFTDNLKKIPRESPKLISFTSGNTSPNPFKKASGSFLWGRLFEKSLPTPSKKFWSVFGEGFSTFQGWKKGGDSHSVCLLFPVRFFPNGDLFILTDLILLSVPTIIDKKTSPHRSILFQNRKEKQKSDRRIPDAFLPFLFSVNRNL